jgi:hypothetical protein
MFMLYVDESGTPELSDPNQPLYVLGAVAVHVLKEHKVIHKDLSLELFKWKDRFFHKPETKNPARGSPFEFQAS